MLKMGALQFERISLSCFEQRARTWLQDHAIHPGLRELAGDAADVERLWAPHRHRLRDRSEHDAAVMLSFVLVCKLEGISAVNGLNQALARPVPDILMKRFMAERGHLRFSDFDLPLQAD